MLADTRQIDSFDRPEDASADSPLIVLQAWQGGVPTPAKPGAVALLQLLTSSEVADLSAITEVIRNDPGLTVQLLRFADKTLGKAPEIDLILGELIVLLGLEQLRAMAAEAVLLTPPDSYY